MANWIITLDPEFFQKIGDYNYCNLEDMVLPNIIAYDSETTNLKSILGDIFAIQIGTGKDNYLIHCYDNNYTPQDVIPYLEGKTLVGQNLTFDLGFLYKYGFYPTKTKDTFIASKILYNGIHSYRHDFGAIFKREMNIIYDKTEQKNIHSVKLSTRESINYCFQDVDRILELIEILENKIDLGGYRETYDLHCEHIQALAYMESCGLPFNTENWINKIQEDKKEAIKSENIIIDYIFNNLPKYRDKQIDLFDSNKRLNISISSPKQMIEVFKDLKINIINDEGKESIAENIINKSSHEFVELWLNYQSNKHTLTTFGANILEKVVNGRIYTAYNPILDTARLSTRRGDVNTLNLPANERTRRCIEAKEGYTMVGADYKNQEAYYLCDQSQDLALIESIKDNIDIHTQLAKKIYPELAHLSDKEFKELHNDKRQEGKVGNFTISFGGNGFTIAKNLNTSTEKGDLIYNAYKELHEGIFTWGEANLTKALKNGYIESVNGFKLHLPYFEEFKQAEKKVKSITKDEWSLYKEGKKEAKAYFEAKEAKKIYEIVNKEAYTFYKENKVFLSKYYKLKSQYFRLVLNNPIQTGASHMTKKATVFLFNYIRSNNHLNKVKIALVLHDEINLEVENSLVEEYKTVLTKCMEDAGNSYLISGLFSMSAESQAGQRWNDIK